MINTSASPELLYVSVIMKDYMKLSFLLILTIMGENPDVSKPLSFQVKGGLFLNFCTLYFL